MTNSIYGKLCTIIYDLDKPFSTSEEFEVYTRYIKQKNEKILEPMCGSGRFLIPLLRDGYDISGFDLSQEMLNACKTKCHKLNLSTKLINADIVNYNFREKYKYIFIPIGSISLIIDEDDLKKAFKNMFNILEEKGVFIFSFLGFEDKVDDQADWIDSMKYMIEENQIVCKYKSTFNTENSIVNMELLYQLLNNNMVVEEEYQNFPIKLLSVEYMKEILINTGFKNVEKLNGTNPKNECNILKAEK